MRSRFALVWLCVTAAGCGGRTLLDAGEIDDERGPGAAGAPSIQPGGGGNGRGGSWGSAASGGGGNAEAGTSTGGTTTGGGSDPIAGGTSIAGRTTSPDGFPITPSPDVNCTPANAKGGMACTVPCATTCGFYDMGTKACDCVSGVFVSCHCPRPWNYQGRTTAPACATPDGRTHWIDNTPCDEEWAECIGSDPVSGVNPRGCVCLTDPVNGRLEWTCGSTNRWFVPE